MVSYAHGYEASAWYILEVTEGTTPATPAYLSLANHVTITESETPNINFVRKSGSVDFASAQKGIVDPRIKLTFNPNQANGLNFLVNYASSDSSVTIVTKNQNTGQFLRRYPGVKVADLTVNAKLYPREDVTSADIEAWAWQILYADVAGSSYETIPNSAINWSDVTVKIAAATLTDWWDAQFNIRNELYRLRDNAGVTTNIKRGTREGKGTITRGMQGTDQAQTEFQATEAATSTAFEIDLLAHTFQFLTGTYTDVTVTNPITDMESKKLSFQGSTITIT